MSEATCERTRSWRRHRWFHHVTPTCRLRTEGVEDRVEDLEAWTAEVWSELGELGELG
jgi:hypothetical protein